MIRILIAALALLVPCAAGASPPHTFSLPISIIDNRVFVDVRLNGKGPYHFLLDTGGEADIPDTLSRTLGLDVKDAGEGLGVGARAERYGTATVREVRVGALTLNDVTFNTMAFDDMPPVFGTRPVDGVIGRPVFESMTVTLDYSRRRATFVPPDEFTYRGSGTVLAFERPVQIPVIAASLDGISGKFGVDTGARSALLLYGPFCAQNALAAKYGAKLEGVTGWGLGGPVRSLLARAHVFSMGNASVREPVIRLSTQKSGLTTSSAMAGLVGPDVLSQFVVTFDYARKRIILEKGPDYGRHDSYDRAGVWMGQDGNAFFAVDVIKGGPADAAGVKTGDRILAIDGVSTANLILPDVRERMRRRAAGSIVTLLVESGGRQRTATLTLHDLV